MAEIQPNPPTTIPATPAKSQRVLSCVLCQQRKIKCDRTFPCANCLKAKVQCVPANQIPRRRKRRFAERELLDRLRHYESLLHQNDIKFNSLHGDAVGERDERQSVNLEAESVDEDSRESPVFSAPSQSPQGKYRAKSFWRAMNESPGPEDPDTPAPPDVNESVVKNTWDQVYSANDPLFGSKDTPDLSELHPEPSHIFKLWQVYLDNVDPLFKVTHTPTLQGRIIEAITNLKNVKPALEALMFSIYCMATLSVMSYESDALVGPPQNETLAKYQAACRQALIRAQFLRSDDRDCLTAQFLYLVSLRPTTDPRTLSSMLGIAIRVAQRMCLHSEAACCEYPPLEAEMRRRLWWALILFDTRIGEMADYRTTHLTPLWDCKVPLNVNDSDLRPEMRSPPKVQGKSSEALFAVARSEIGEFLRHSSAHLDFTCPALKIVARKAHPELGAGVDEIDAWEQYIEDRYLRYCDPENPLHFITIWMMRHTLAKCRLVSYYSKSSPGRPTDAQRDAAVPHALRMLETDTKILRSPNAQRYLWLMHFHFPFPAYLHLLQDLRKRPLSNHAQRCWNLMSENFEARAKCLRLVSPNLLFKTITATVFHAWEVTESALRQSGHSHETPKIVYIMRNWLYKETVTSDPEVSCDQPITHGQSSPWPTQMGMTLTSEDPFTPMAGNIAYPGLAPWMTFDMAGQMGGSMGPTQPDWSFLNWGL
ncbi:hypothetical protein BJY01DRAFT_200660 [Aspergillus pseudoustus]|uniref:Zn(2)-C6 fungal-type domain-containing protein n=1 Tax=Aspergillus pseudoustus TaxID=1810923 RepID=A0ABR4JRB2_9EURO